MKPLRRALRYYQVWYRVVLYSMHGRTNELFVTSSLWRKKAAAAAVVVVIGSHFVDRSSSAASAAVVATTIAVATCQRTMCFRLIVTLAHINNEHKNSTITENNGRFIFFYFSANFWASALKTTILSISYQNTHTHTHIRPDCRVLYCSVLFSILCIGLLFSLPLFSRQTNLLRVVVSELPDN